MDSPVPSAPPRGRPPPRIPSGGLVLLLLAVLFAARGVRDASAHFPPPVYFGIRITETAVDWRLVLTYDVARSWFGIDPKEMEERGDLPEADRGKVMERVAEWMHVRIDRLPVGGVLHQATSELYMDHGIDYEYVNLVVRFETKGAPKEVALAWTSYQTPSGYIFPSIECEIDGLGSSVYPVFRETEPEFVWHAPRERAPAPSLVLPEPPPPPTVEIPVASVALLLFALASFAVATRRGVARGRRWGGLAAALALAILILPLARQRVRLPGGSGFQPPPEKEALYVFEALLRNVYRAFDHDSEDAVYDTLATSVTGDLLDDLYTEVHSSLVMQSQGGAVCKIETVTLDESEVMPAEDPRAPYFKVRARWTVEGKVGHWGHTHQRINRYQADFTVIQDGGAWKIAAMEVRELKRMDDGRDAR